MDLTIEIRQERRGRVQAVCSALPGCVGAGKDREEAVRHFVDAARGYLGAVGDFVPARLGTRIRNGEAGGAG